MSEWYRCEACGGVYQAVCADGLRYFHRCAPLVNIETGEATERPGQRDENVAVDVLGCARGMRAEGRGRMLVDVGPPVAVLEGPRAAAAPEAVAAAEVAEAAPVERGWLARLWDGLWGRGGS